MAEKWLHLKDQSYLEKIESRNDNTESPAFTSLHELHTYIVVSVTLQ